MRLSFMAVTVIFAAVGCSFGTDDSAAGPDTSDSGQTDTGDSGDTGVLPHAVGDVFDLETTATGVAGTFVEPGSYVVILFSAAKTRDAMFGYGAKAGDAAVVSDTTLPRPVRPVVLPSAGLDAGGTRAFTVWDGSVNVTVSAELVATTDDLVVWRDVTTESPLGDVDPKVLEEVEQKFQDIVLPRTRQVFGEEPDVDGNGRFNVLISYTVNTYGPVAYVSTCDIAALPGCGGSGNGGETIYMGIPDPESPYSSPDAIVELWAHEMNHLVYSWHKLVLNEQLDAGENIYVTEGMSELAQDLTGYNNGNQYIWASAIDMSSVYGESGTSTDDVSLNDFLRGTGYYDETRDGPLRGGAYLFLRYLFEQAGGMSVAGDGTLGDEGGITFLHNWFDVPEMGPDCVMAVTGRDAVDVAFDWYTALLVTGRGINDDPVYNYQDRVVDPITGYAFGVDPYATIHGWLTLTGPPVQPIDDADGSIRAGGVEYLRVDVTEARSLEIPVDPDAKAMARALRIE